MKIVAIIVLSLLLAASIISGLILFGQYQNTKYALRLSHNQLVSLNEQVVQLNQETSEQLLYRMKDYNPVICRETWPWAYKYRDLGATGYIDPKQGAPGLIPSFTQGTAAIIMACERINPYKIILVGFDNLLAGTSENFQSIHRAYDGLGPHTTRHDLATERKLLDQIKKHYNANKSEKK